MCFSDLLRRFMAVHGFSSRGLSRQANKLAADVPGWRPLHHDGDGIENWLRPRRSWRRPKSIRPRYWMQLAAIAQILELDEVEAQEFFQAAGWSLDGLRVKATVEQRHLVDFGQPALLENSPVRVSEGSELVPASGGIVPFRRGGKSLVKWRRSPLHAPSRPWIALSAAVAIIGVAAAAIVIARPSEDAGVVDDARSDVSDGPTAGANPAGDDGQEAAESAEPASPALPSIPIGRSCMIDLADQPYGPEYIVGQQPEECPDLRISNQYASYSGDDLLPWDQGVAQCYAGPPLIRLWVGFDLSDGTEGWLPLSGGTSADIFVEDRPSEPELRVTPEVGATSIGTFEYSDLAGNAFAVQLDLPERLDPTLADERGKYHLGGCWQQADRDGHRGLNFFWPPGVNP